MRSDNLNKHKKICKGILSSQTPEKDVDIIGVSNLPPMTNPIIKIEETDSEELEPEDDGTDANQEEDDYESKLQGKFQHLFMEFNSNIDNLHNLLSELNKIQYLTYYECKAICDHFQEKIQNF